MIKKVLAIAVSVQLIMPLSLMASVQSDSTPTAKDVAVLLDKPQQTIKNYGIGGVIGAGATAFAVYVAYTAIRITKLSAKNTELSKQVASLFSRLEQSSKEAASNTNISAKQGKVLLATNKRITKSNAERAAQVSLLKKENAALAQQLAESDAALKLLKEGQDNFAKVLNQHAGLINKNMQGINMAFGTLENHAQAINTNAALVQEMVEKGNAPRPVIGFGAKRTMPSIEKRVARQEANGSLELVENIARSMGASSAKNHILSPDVLSKAKFFVRRNAGKMGLAGVALLITASLLPQHTQAAQISQTRLSYSRALASAKASNKEYYAITALELAKHNKPLVAAIIAENAQSDASLYPMFKSQIEELSSKETLSLAAQISGGLSDYGKADKKANLLMQLKQVDYSTVLWH